MPDEVEGKLIVTGPDAEVTYEAIGALDAIASLRVRNREVEQISDAYFDSPDRRLFIARVALRVRNLNGRELLTLKGETRVSDGVLSREELEVEWSPEGLDEVLEALSQAGISLGDIDAARAATTAREAMRALGLEGSAARENRRVALRLARDDTVVAEVAVDAVLLTAGEHRVRHYEVECESKGSGDAAVVRSVLGDLQSKYAGLRSWHVSKLDLAQSLEILADQGRLEALLDGDRLRSDAYGTIEAVTEEHLRPGARQA
jgi:inorganic triphosphatase YgiF